MATTTVTACGDEADDGAGVREASGSASPGGASAGVPGGSASGSGTAGGSGSASSSSPPPCASTGTSTEAPTATVEARLSAFVIEAIPAEVPAGTVNIVAVNMGFEPHEVVVLRYDSDPADLPVAEDGTLDEAALPDGTVVGEIEGFIGQQESPETVDDHDLILLNGPTACPGAFDLEPGTYLLLCNIRAEHYDGEMRAHFEQGMYTVLTVS